MPIPIIEIGEQVERIYSPYSGMVIAQDEQADESDPSLLFINYGSGGYISQRLIDHLEETPQFSMVTEEIAAQITVPGAVVFRHDCGWNGVMLYGFAPAEQ